MSIITKLLNRSVTVFALVGESGTGKSFRAKLLSEKYGIEAMIDDGLLIRDDRILAGKSASLDTMPTSDFLEQYLEDCQERPEAQYLQ